MCRACLVVMSSSSHRAVWPEAWPRTKCNDFGLSPLETSSNALQKIWRGVRFSSVYEEFYYEPDNDNGELSEPLQPGDVLPNSCIATGEDLSNFPAKNLSIMHSPVHAEWSNLIFTARMSVLMLAPGIGDAIPYIEMGLSNPVPLDQVTISAFRVPRYEEKEDCGVENFDSFSCLNIVVSYTHQIDEARRETSILKASEGQWNQLEEILRGIREQAPDDVKFVRLWTDQILSARIRSKKNMAGKEGTEVTPPKNQISWVVYGLLPYVIYTVASLQSDKLSDSVSMWSACEQILGDAGAGILISVPAVLQIGRPKLCKDALYGPSRSSSTLFVAGDRLSVSRCFERLAFAIHSGLLDDMVTFHISDAQALIRFSYYITRITDSNIFHGLNCESCLTVTRREHLEFHWALHNASDRIDENVEPDLRRRLTRYRASYAYPKARARQGFISWHGYREFVPGAGRVARFAEEPMSTQFRKHCYYARFQPNAGNEDSNQLCLVVAAVPFVKESWITNYIALLVRGQNLYNSRESKVEWSVRLNFIDLEKFHVTFKDHRDSLLGNKLTDLFRHPDLDAILEHLQISKTQPFHLLSSLRWGFRESGREELLPAETECSTFLSAFLPVG